LNSVMVDKWFKETFTKEEKLAKAQELYDKLKVDHEKFLNGVKYSPSRIRAFTGEHRDICEMVAFKMSEARNSEKVS